MNFSKPNHVLYAKEGVLVPSGEKRKTGFMQIAIWSVVSVLILASLIFHSNLFFEMPWTTQVLLLVLVASFGFRGKKMAMVASPFELWFYDKYFVLYRPMKYYSKRMSRKEICYMKYSDVTKCIYKTRSQRIHFYGSGISEFYNANTAGVASETPTKTKHYTGGLLYFNTSMDTVDFKKEIEEHSPIRVLEENT